MKKYIIPIFFVSVLVFSVIISYGYRVITMPKEEIEYKTQKNKLSDTEVEMINRGGEFEKQILPAEDGYRNYLIYELKITRKRNGFGWTTKVDTLKSYIRKDECGC
jgi:hypothetical protein